MVLSGPGALFVFNRLNNDDDLFNGNLSCVNVYVFISNIAGNLFCVRGAVVVPMISAEVFGYNFCLFRWQHPVSSDVFLRCEIQNEFAFAVLYSLPLVLN